jgi:hypothetical protein
MMRRALMLAMMVITFVAFPQWVLGEDPIPECDPCPFGDPPPKPPKP